MRNIEDYLFHKNNFLDSNFCKESVTVLEEGIWHKHHWDHYTGKSNTESSYPSGDKEPEVLLVDAGWSEQNKLKNSFMNKHIVEKLYEALYEYLWFAQENSLEGWVGYSAIKFIRYKNGQQMKEHYDAIHSLFDGDRKGIPLLSIIGTLNDNYEGGELVMFGEKKIEIKRGDLLIFPSTFLYPHKVNPVTEGARYSYVSWAW